MQYRYWFVLLLLGIVAFVPASAQINNAYISDEAVLDTSNTQQLNFELKSFNYLRNTEYFNKTESGQTLFGTILSPSFTLKLKNIKLNAGVFLQQNFGSTQIVNILPQATLSINGRYGVFNFGTLNGALAHQIAEPLFNINNAIENRIEQGAQFVINNPQLFLDTWINWQNNMPYKGFNHERFTAGLNITPATNRSNRFYATAPFNVLLHHKGGQLSSDTGAQYTAFNWSAGLSANFALHKNTLITLQHQYLFTAPDISNSLTGTAHFTTLSYTVNHSSLMINYFKGTNLNTPFGTYIYQSLSRDNLNYYERERQLLFLRYFYNLKISKQLNISARFEPFYDIKNTVLDYSYSVYLFFRLNQKLTRISPE